MGSRSRPDRPAPRLLSTLLVLGAAWSTPGLTAVLSPGPLSRPHAELDRETLCVRCHGTGEQGPGDRCVECHKEIGWLMERGRGLHGPPAQPGCADCHGEHAGVDASLLPAGWKDERTFDHGRAGFPLRGKHATTRCEDCHTARFRVSEVLSLSPRKDKTGGYLGLEPDCASCHPDPHRGAEGGDCQRCHVPTVWKPAAGFDHATASFPLEGAHAKVACVKCHEKAYAPPTAPGALPVRAFRPVPHRECSDCHEDPHRAQLGPQCSRCHVAESFRRVDREAFDHARTRYPLHGRHASVECASCHDPARGGSKKPRFAACGDCHADAHAGGATLAGKKVDCAACHDVTGFDRSTFTVEQHRRSAFPLEGKHVETRCDRCHLRVENAAAGAERLGRAAVLLRPGHVRCLDCHRDLHGGQFSSRPDGGECASCHTVDGWKPSTYPAAAHAEAGFPLEGRHAAATCAACHGQRAKGPASRAAPETTGRARVALRLGEVACVACHDDPHKGRFAGRGAEAGCGNCHGAEAFRPAVMGPGAHASLGFPLEGAHRAARCERCHAELRHEGNGVAPVTVSVSDPRCEFCHASPHGDQFDARPDHGVCASCHDETSFRPAGRFRHDRGTRFPLLRAHGRLECGRCHEMETDASGRPVTRYRPVSPDCRECHRRTRAVADDDRFPASGRRTRP